ncbi:amine oxidase [flavin-containing] B-like [Lineus longissimus]|uniref:amine oxidase [flavin-containing] B-like n=1 Tax=Lineus longissimus TaxID=88925 RepID=UPI00315DE157
MYSSMRVFPPCTCTSVSRATHFLSAAARSGTFFYNRSSHLSSFSQLSSFSPGTNKLENHHKIGLLTKGSNKHKRFSTAPVTNVTDASIMADKMARTSRVDLKTNYADDIERADVVVIGGGISGLCAAKLLKEEGLGVIVLEAKDRVGGRTLTAKDPSFGYVDLGGAYVGPTQDRILRLAKELKVETYKVDIEGKTTIITDSRRTTDDKVYNPIVLLDRLNTRRTINAFAKQVPLDTPWEAPRAKEWDSMNLAQFSENLCWTKYVRDDLQNQLNGLFSYDLNEVSLLFALWTLHSGGCLEQMNCIENGAQESKFVGGAQQISEKMADILGGCVKLSSPVLEIDQSGEEVMLTTEHGRKFSAPHVISAMPISILNKITFCPSLPTAKVELSKGMPMGSVIKTHMYYEKQHWKDKGLSGSLDSSNGPVENSLNDTKPDGSYPCLVGFINGEKAKEFTSLTKEERKQQQADYYAEMFEIEEMGRPIGYEELIWMEEEYIGGGYCGIMPPGVLTTYGPTLQEPVGNVHFAGAEAATVWTGFMDGAVQSGERAAREILHKLGRTSKEEKAPK